MDTKTFIENFHKMCNHYWRCGECPMCVSGACLFLSDEHEPLNVESIIEIVTNWGDETRPIKTNGDKVLSVIPASIREEGKRRYDKYEEIKPDITYGNYTPIESFVCFFVPTEWWNAELEDNE